MHAEAAGGLGDIVAAGLVDLLDVFPAHPGRRQRRRGRTGATAGHRGQQGFGQFQRLGDRRFLVELVQRVQHHPLDAFRLVQRSANAFRLDLAAGEEAAAPVVERLRGSLARLGWDAPRIACRIVPRDSLRAAAKPAPFASFRGEP